MTETTLNEEKQNSITLKKGAKGYLWEIKVYFNDDEENTLKRIEEIDSHLKAKYGE